MKYSASEKLSAVERELKYRRQPRGWLKYPRLIEQGKMTDAAAAWQIRTFEAIADDYRRLAEKERLL